MDEGGHIVVRPNNGHIETIAGGRRVEAIRKYTDLKEIPARIVNADNTQARRISATENLVRENLSVIETIETIVEIVDAELIEDKQYESMGKNPAGRVKMLLGKLHSIKSSKKRGSQVSKEAEQLLNKYIQQVEEIFDNLPKPLEWRSFLNNDLPILDTSGMNRR